MHLSVFKFDMDFCIYSATIQINIFLKVLTFLIFCKCVFMKFLTILNINLVLIQLFYITEFFPHWKMKTSRFTIKSFLPLKWVLVKIIWELDYWVNIKYLTQDTSQISTYLCFLSYSSTCLVSSIVVRADENFLVLQKFTIW